jgi:photosystem II stability/assembly factor-like uncharacterized protein
MKKILLLVLLFQYTNDAQWYWQNPKPQGNEIEYISMFEDELLFFTRENIYKSSNQGKDWIENSYQNDFPIKVFNNKGDNFWGTKWTQQNGTQFYKSSDRGTSWSALSSIAGNLNKLGVIENFCWYLTDNYYGQHWSLAISNNGGASWDTVQNFTYSVNDIQFIDSIIGFAVAPNINGQSLLLKTVDSGLNWETISTFQGIIGPINFYNKFIGTIAGTPALKTTDGGATWNSLNISYRILIIDSLVMYAYGSTGLYKTNDAGISWITLLNKSLHRVTVLSDKIFTNKNLDMYYSEDDGLTWDTLYSTNSIFNILHSICFWDSLTGITVGQNGSVYKTTNGGILWYPKNSNTTVHLNNVICLKQNNSWILGNNGTILFSDDQGDNWIEKTINSNISASEIYAFDNIIYVTRMVNDGYWNTNNYYKSTNYGNTWELKSFPHKSPPYGYSTYSSFFLDSLKGWAITSFPQAIFKTSDGGHTWVKYYSLPYGISELLSLKLFSSEFGYLYKGRSLFVTTNGGQSWNSRFVPNPGYTTGAWTAYILDENTIFISPNSSNRAFIYKSFDSGLTFQHEFTNYSYLKALFFINRTLGWAIGHKCIISTFNSPILSVFQQSYNQYEESILIQNYPNPFNPSTKIRYSIPHSSKVTLKVFDVLGKEVAVLVNEEKAAGEYEVEFSVGSFGDGSKLSSGVYFYQLKAGSFIQTNKMVLMR